MSDEKRNVTLGETLVSLLKERSLSMRKLSAATGIDTATISRIVNGKQRAKPEHLEAFALHLDVPSAPLFQAAGYGAPAPLLIRTSRTISTPPSTALKKFFKPPTSLTTSLMPSWFRKN